MGLGWFQSPSTTLGKLLHDSLLKIKHVIIEKICKNTKEVVQALVFLIFQL